MQKVLTSLLFIGMTLSSGAITTSESPASVAKESNSMQLSFDGSSYFHRWSNAGQNEFTEKDQTDLNNWKQMVTIQVYDSVKNGDQLAATAGQVVENYKAHGKIIRIDSKPRTADKPAEHMAVAVLGTPKFLEAAFARFLLVDGTGVAVIYSHRIYGTAAGPQMSTWLQSNGPGLEKTLMSWDKIPSVTALQKLPQSKE